MAIDAKNIPRKRGKGQPTFEVVTVDDSWDKLNMLIYGPPGIGKTTMAATSNLVEQMRPVHLIDNDGGSRTLQGKEVFRGITIYRVNIFEAYNEIFSAVVDAIDAGKCRTVIIDNIAALHQIAMDLQMEETRNKDPNREEHVPGMREYGIVRSMLTKITRYFSGLPANLIMTAHAELDKDEVTGLIRIRPSVPGKLSHEMPGFMNVVGYMDLDIEKVKKGAKFERILRRKIIFVPADNKLEVKDTSDKLGGLIVGDDQMQMSIIADKIGLSMPPVIKVSPNGTGARSDRRKGGLGSKK